VVVVEETVEMGREEGERREETRNYREWRDGLERGVEEEERQNAIRQ